jgi:predicted MFS family arabinose efflux permease
MVVRRTRQTRQATRPGGETQAGGAAACLPSDNVCTMITLERETLRAYGVFIAGFLTFFNLYTPQAFLQILAHDIGVSPLQIGLTVTVTLLAVSFIAPVAGALSDRFGRKRFIVGAAYALILPTLMVAASHSLNELLFWRTAQGLLLPFIFTVTVAYVSDECSGPQAIKTSGIYAAGTIFGGFSGRFLGGIIADLDGWRTAFVTMAFITVGLASLVAWLMPREVNFRPVLGGIEANIRAYREHLHNKRLLATCVIGFGMLFSMVACFTFVNFYLADAPFELSPTQVGSVFAVYLLGMVSAPLATRVAVQIGRVPALMAALGVSTLGFLATTVSSLPVVVAGLAFSTAGLLVTQALSLGFIGAIVPRARSSAVGLYVTVFYTGGALGGVLPGPLWREFGWIGVLGLLWVILAIMAFTALRYWRLPPKSIT